MPKPIRMRSPSLGEGILTSDHAASSYGVPVFVVSGNAYGPGNLPEPLELLELKDARRVREIRHRFEQWRPAILDRRDRQALRDAEPDEPTISRSVRLPENLAARVAAQPGGFSEAVRQALELWLAQKKG